MHGRVHSWCALQTMCNMAGAKQARDLQSGKPACRFLSPCSSAAALQLALFAEPCTVLVKQLLCGWPAGWVLGQHGRHQRPCVRGHCLPGWQRQVWLSLCNVGQALRCRAARHATGSAQAARRPTGAPHWTCTEIGCREALMESAAAVKQFGDT